VRLDINQRGAPCIVHRPSSIVHRPSSIVHRPALGSPLCSWAAARA
jgi:hypothetical protein